MLAYNGQDRPTLAEVSAHPWMAIDSNDTNMAPNAIKEEINEKRETLTSQCHRVYQPCRCGSMLSMVRHGGEYWRWDQMFDDITAYEIDF